MAQTKKKRQRKKRGTQAGAIDTRRKARPRNRADARAQAKNSREKGGSRGGRNSLTDRPPTWQGAAFRGLIAACVFTLILLVGFGKGFGYSVGIGLGMLILYVPAGYYMDSYLWRRRERTRIRERSKG